MDIFDAKCIVEAIVDYFLINYSGSFCFIYSQKAEKQQKWSRDLGDKCKDAELLPSSYILFPAMDSSQILLMGVKLKLY